VTLLPASCTNSQLASAVLLDEYHSSYP